MPAPLAYLLTWTTYGTWLPGDERGWVESGNFEIQPGDKRRRNAAHERMTDSTVTLDPAQRAIVEATIRKHCEIRSWILHAINVRTNHVHVVVTADVAPETVMRQFKAWCSRRLSEHTTAQKWWTEHGSTKWINDEEYLQYAIRYVRERQ